LVFIGTTGVVVALEVDADDTSGSLSSPLKT
jgi:hypothetical protein